MVDSSRYFLPGVLIGCASLLLLLLNGSQTLADSLFRNRKGSGELQRFFHKLVTLASFWLALSGFAAAYSIYGTPMLVAVAAYDQMLLCGVLCIMKLVQLTVKTAYEVHYQSPPGLLRSLFYIVGVGSYVAAIVSFVVALTLNRLDYRSILDFTLMLPWSGVPILCNYYFCTLLRSIRKSQAGMTVRSFCFSPWN